MNTHEILMSYVIDCLLENSFELCIYITKFVYIYLYNMVFVVIFFNGMVYLSIIDESFHQ
jgi:hypothetical protein